MHRADLEQVIESMIRETAADICAACASSSGYNLHEIACAILDPDDIMSVHDVAEWPEVVLANEAYREMWYGYDFDDPDRFSFRVRWAGAEALLRTGWTGPQ